MASQKPPKGDFFFVNKTTRSDAFSYSSGEEATGIRRHVQHISRAKNKIRSLQALRSQSLPVKAIVQRGHTHPTSSLENTDQSNSQAHDSVPRNPSTLVSANAHRSASEHGKSSNAIASTSSAPYESEDPDDALISSSLVTSNSWSHFNNDEEDEDPEDFSIWQRNKPVNLQTTLGQGRADPFAEFAVGSLSDVAKRIIDHGLQHYWPGLTPGNMPANRATFEATRNSPLAYYAYLIAVSRNYDFLCGVHPNIREHTRLRLTHRVATIRLINDTIRDLTGPPPDELIGAVLVLTAADPIDFGEATSYSSSRFCSPLATAQWLNMYGAQPFVAAHAIGLVELIRLKGGWDQFKTDGLARIAEYADIINASQSSSNPFFPAVDRPESLILAGKHNADAEAAILHSKLATGFQELIDAYNAIELEEAVYALSRTTIVLDQFHRRSPEAPTFADVVDARNGAQHLALSLPFMQSGTATDDKAWMFQICRTAILLYSNAVIFPLPTSCGAETRLVLTLKALLESLYTWKSQPKMVFWALVLGGISCSSGPVRSWFVDQIATLSLFLDIREWNDVEECLFSFLWLDFVLGEAAVDLWMESQPMTGRLDLTEANIDLYP